MRKKSILIAIKASARPCASIDRRNKTEIKSNKKKSAQEISIKRALLAIFVKKCHVYMKATEVFALFPLMIGSCVFGNWCNCLNIDRAIRLEVFVCLLLPPKPQAILINDFIKMNEQCQKEIRKKYQSFYESDNNFFRCRFTRDIVEEEEQPLALSALEGFCSLSGERLRCFFSFSFKWSRIFFYLWRGFLIGNLLIWFTCEWVKEKRFEFIQSL